MYFKKELGKASAPQADVAALVEDAALVIRAALRLSVKNRLIVSAVREGADYDEGRLLDVVRREISSILAEKEDEGRRLADAVERARSRRGYPTSAADYRRRDVPALTLRREVNDALIERLRASAHDSAQLLRVLHEARAAALDEVVHPRLPLRAPLDDRYEDERETRMAALKRELALLVEETDPSRA